MVNRQGRLILPLLGLGLILSGSPALAQDPLSAIDWLSRSVTAPGAQGIGEPAVSGAGEALPQTVVTSVLGASSPDAVGVLPPESAGLPENLWGVGQTAEIARIIADERTESLPALQGLLLTLLLTEAEPPPDAGGKGIFLRARIDKLLAMGALDQAQALIEAAGAVTPELFRRAFDIAMLTGTEDQACETLTDNISLAPTYPARVFCLARAGDWNAAALTLRMAQALGYVSEAEDALLSRFLDPDLSDGEPPLPQPDPITPLDWRMLEAIGEGLPTQGLPLAFSHAELRENVGWKAQIEAAERLGRAGVIDPNLLLGIYTARQPAASGGVWDRVEAFQKFETALAAGDLDAVSATLAPAWSAMAEADLELAFATLFAERLGELSLSGKAGALAFRIALLSSGYEAAARARKPEDAMEAFLIGIATDKLRDIPPPNSLARAIAPAFLQPATSDDLAALLEERRIGEAILGATDRIARGLHGESRLVAEGLSLFQLLGMKDLTRRTALQLLLLERRG
ncbi:MAG: hypothetical protein ACK5M4_14520 [Pseudorhodobacter sp.]